MFILRLRKRIANTRAHFTRGFFGEGDGKDGANGIALLQQMQIAPNKREGFSRTRARGHRDGARRIGHGFFLVAFEGVVGEESHRVISDQWRLRFLGFGFSTATRFSVSGLRK